MATKDGSSVMKVNSPEDLGDVKRVSVTWNTTSAAHEGVQFLLEQGAEIAFYRSAYNADAAKEKREYDKAVVAAVSESIKTGKPVQEILGAKGITVKA
jgi:hypothetical protein